MEIVTKRRRVTWNGYFKCFLLTSIDNFCVQVAPAVVNVTVVLEDSLWSTWGPMVMSQSSGTGFLIDKSGYLLTNAHVVAQARAGGTIQITLQDGRNFAGRVTNYDSLSDLAVVKV